MKLFASLTLALTLLLSSGCATIQRAATVNLPFATVEAQVVCGGVLKYAVDDASRDDIAKMIYYAGDVAAEYASGTVPTPEQFKSFLEAEGIGKVAKYQPIIDELVKLYTSRVAQLQGDPKLANDYIHAIATGCKLAAKPYVNDPSV